MPPKGGLSDKFGNIYEAKIAVVRAFDLIDDLRDAARMRVEVPGLDEFEWWVQRRDGSKEYTQVKRQLSADAEWKIGTLISRGVLGDFGRLLGTDPRATCNFSSTLSASHLQELTESARAAKDPAEFESKLLGSAEKKASWRAVQNAWNDASADEALSWLKRIEARIADPKTLDELLYARARALVKGDPHNVIARVDAFLGQNLARELTETDVWDFLCDEAGFEPTDWYRNESLHAAIRDATVRYVDGAVRDRGALAEIPRDAAEQVATSLQDAESPEVVTVVASAGMGKTAVLAQALRLLVEHNRNASPPLVLAARLDRLPDFHDGPSLGKALQLPGSPAAVLSRVAGERSALLVLDQVDAFGAGSGRKPWLLDAVAEVVSDARRLGVRVLLACREFDVEMDRRLSALIGVEQGSEPAQGLAMVRLAELASEEVQRVLQDSGVDPGSIPEPLHRVLRTPLHLQVLVALHTRSGLDPSGISTRWQLFDEFYRMVRTEVEGRYPGAQVATVNDRLAELLSTHQELSAPLVRFQDRTTVEHMASAGWLRSDGQRLAFAHEAFFDYAYAALHLREDRSLRQMLLEKEQHLFRRAQVRQILTVARDQDRDRYLTDLNELLAADDIRVHIKDMVIALVSRVSDPTRGEWDALCTIGDVTTDLLARRAHWAAARQAPFGDLLMNEKIIEAYLADPALADTGAWLCQILLERHCDEIVVLLEPHVGEAGWDHRIMGVIQVGKLPTRQRLVDLMVKVLDAGVLDHSLAQTGDQHDIFMRLFGFSGARAAWGARILGSALRRRIVLITGAAPGRLGEREQPQPADEVDLRDRIRRLAVRERTQQETRLLPQSKVAKDILAALAEGDPVAFVHEILAPVRAAAHASRTGKVDDQGERSSALGHFAWRDLQVDPTAILVARLADAVKQAVLQGDPATRQAVREMLDSPLAAEQLLAGCGLTARHEDLLDDALHWLEGAPHALGQGWIRHPLGVAADVLAWVIEQRPVEQTARLQQHVSEYTPTYETEQTRGRAALYLLRAIPDDRLSPTAAGRKAELEAKFPHEPQPIPHGGRTGAFGGFSGPDLPPIPLEILAEMSDPELVEAMRTHAEENVQYLGDGHAMGGASALAQAIATLVCPDPARVVALLEALPDDVVQVYRIQLLGGLINAADADLAIRAARATRSHLEACRHELSMIISMSAANGGAAVLSEQTAAALAAIIQEILA